LRAGDQRSYATPQVALTPLLMMWLGSVSASKSPWFFSFYLFPDPDQHRQRCEKRQRSDGRSGARLFSAAGQILFKVIVGRAAVFMAGVRIAIGRALVGMIVAELFTAITGSARCCRCTAIFLKRRRLFVVIVVLRCWASV